jgi:hypothetical protein
MDDDNDEGNGEDDDEDGDKDDNEDAGIANRRRCSMQASAVLAGGNDEVASRAVP